MTGAHWSDHADAAARRRSVEWIRLFSLGASVFAALCFAALLLLLAMDALLLVREQGVWNTISGTRWHYRAGEFGALPLVFGTCVVALVALLLAAPLGLGAALWLSEMVDQRARMPLKAVIELLAGIPSVIYGLLGVLVLRSAMDRLLSPIGAASGDSLLTGGVLLAVMILPTLTTLADDALRGVPRAQREGARALGMTRAETVLALVAPQARRGLAAALLLALGRALGETIAVFLVIGRQDNQLPRSWTTLDAWIAPGQTLTSKLGGSETYIAVGDALHWSAVTALALLLATIVLGVTSIGTRWMQSPESDGDPDHAPPLA